MAGKLNYSRTHPTTSDVANIRYVICKIGKYYSVGDYMVLIERVTDLDQYDLQTLLNESLIEGHQFVKRLIDEYFSNENKFDRVGEVLYVAINKDRVIGVGGLNIDPYLNSPEIGRVRHLYVLDKNRGSGVGNELLINMINDARKHFRKLTLYTKNPLADKLYIHSGFKKTDDLFKATHVMELTSLNK